MTASALVAHPIRELVDRVLALQDDAALFGPDVSANEAFAYARDKSFAAVRVVKNKLETTPALVASVSGLNSLANGVQAVYNELTAFISNKNTGHLSNRREKQMRHCQSWSRKTEQSDEGGNCS